MSAPNQSNSDQGCGATDCAYREFPERSFGGKPKPDACYMKRSGGNSEPRRIRNETGRWGFSPVNMAVKERKEPDNDCTQPNRRSYRQRDEYA
jgi:hypothetical protein